MAETAKQAEDAKKPCEAKPVLIIMDALLFRSDPTEMTRLNEQLSAEVVQMAFDRNGGVEGLKAGLARFERLKGLFNGIRQLQSIVCEESLPLFNANLQSVAYMIQGCLFYLKAELLAYEKIPDSMIASFPMYD